MSYDGKSSRLTERGRLKGSGVHVEFREDMTVMSGNMRQWKRFMEHPVMQAFAKADKAMRARERSQNGPR